MWVEAEQWPLSIFYKFNMIVSPVKLWRRQDEVSKLIGKSGKIVSFALIRVPAKGFEKLAPYPVVIVEFANGKKITGQLTEWDKNDLKKGKKVIAVLRRLTPQNTESIISYVIKFKPAS